jgi:hypothetical protein
LVIKCRGDPADTGGPVMKGVLACGILIFALMVAIKDGRVLRKAGLTGGCTSVAAPAGQTGSWERCVPGKLEGAPDLSKQGCNVAETYGKTELWRCPAPIDAGPNL